MNFSNQLRKDSNIAFAQRTNAAISIGSFLKMNHLKIKLAVAKMADVEQNLQIFLNFPRTFATWFSLGLYSF